MTYESRAASRSYFHTTPEPAGTVSDLFEDFRGLKSIEHDIMRKRFIHPSSAAMSKATPLLVLTVFFFTHDPTAAARSDRCASPCDVNSCPSLSCPGGRVPDPCNCCPVCRSREGDACGRKNDLPCGDGLECKPVAAGRRRGSKRVCRCRTERAVCGSDGKTYGSACKLRAASRKAQKMGRAAIGQAHTGACSPPGAGRTEMAFCAGNTPWMPLFAARVSSRLTFSLLLWLLCKFLSVIIRLWILPASAGASLAQPSSPRYKFNFIADVVEKIAPAVVHIELFVRCVCVCPGVGV